jgi:hypothetical protein
LSIRNAAGDRPYDDLITFGQQLGCSVVVDWPAWNDQIYQKLKSNPDPNIEGVVLQNQDGERCKVKTDLYVQLHRVLTGNSERAAFEMWRDRSFAPIEGIPDEFFADIRAQLAKIEADWQTCKADMYAKWELLKSEVAAGKSRKDIAIEHKNIVFLLGDAVNNNPPLKVAFENFCRKVYEFGIGPLPLETLLSYRS